MSLFGPATGPSGQLETLGETSKGAKEVRVSTAKETSNTTEKSFCSILPHIALSNPIFNVAYTKSESIVHAKMFGPGTKRVTTSSSAK